jgi:hypothetical protein
VVSIRFKIISVEESTVQEPGVDFSALKCSITGDIMRDAMMLPCHHTFDESTVKKLEGSCPFDRIRFDVKDCWPNESVRQFWRDNLHLETQDVPEFVLPVLGEEASAKAARIYESAKVKFEENKFQEAIDLYTELFTLLPSNHPHVNYGLFCTKLAHDGTFDLDALNKAVAYKTEHYKFYMEARTQALKDKGWL